MVLHVAPIVQRQQKAFKHLRRPVKDIVVPEAQHTKARILKGSIANAISRRIQMLAAVEFDNQPTLHTDEIKNVIAERVLATKLAALQTLCAQMHPQSLFGVRRGPAQFALQSAFADRLVGLA